MENSLHKNTMILLWVNLVSIFLFGCGSAMVSYLDSSHQGTVGAWQFLFAVFGLCLFGYGLIENSKGKGNPNHGTISAVAWLSVIAGVLGFIFAFVMTNVLGIITAILALIAFVCAIVVARK